MKRAFAVLAVIVAVVTVSSCSSCNRTGQMIQWRDKGAVEAAQSLADSDSSDLTDKSAIEFQ